MNYVFCNINFLSWVAALKIWKGLSAEVENFFETAGGVSCRGIGRNVSVMRSRIVCEVYVFVLLYLLVPSFLWHSETHYISLQMLQVKCREWSCSLLHSMFARPPAITDPGQIQTASPGNGVGKVQGCSWSFIQFMVCLWILTFHCWSRSEVLL